ncbi:hypothetical protein [Streptomyces sp. NPDC101145]|uniref:hypothetical protein n=1 Tax=Streptomyces sp. NPDC101145 TaxID=3366112 RepID=UPI00382E32C1
MSFLTTLTRTRKESPVTTAPTPVEQPTATNVVMRFANLVGTPVELYRHAWTEHHYATAHTPAKTFERNGFEWRCTGCDMTGAEKHLRMGEAGYHEAEPRESRNDANTHASTCRALPRPSAA